MPSVGPDLTLPGDSRETLQAELVRLGHELAEAVRAHEQSQHDLDEANSLMALIYERVRRLLALMEGITGSGEGQ